MKKILIFLLISCNAFSQKAVYNKITSENSFKEYETKNGNLITIGDTLSIGLPANGREFLFITQANTPAGTVIANSKAVITKIKTIGNKTRGFKTYALFKGYGLPVYTEIESALEIGEIKEIIPHK
ncbi:hypothetical protein [Flavobacterium johnsoniae]|uniref:Uncharacterized protein n=1 Tax=Flavobacterium johnsoniae TaxID=986 RepID=A0A1M5IL03_FLAJO|nr:hypothetical protein [Flavobacterium johnsoniae]SHG28590.1 hypothetical protein SAMN05444388_102135 [Flavobacterium johnsoniae]